MDNRIVVTGGAGFIGSHVVRRLCDLGFDVVVIDNLSFGRRELIDERAKFVQDDLENYEHLAALINGANAVMHFAASSIIASSFVDPVGYVRNNVGNAVNLLEAMRLASVPLLINSSSAAVYGNPGTIPISEDAPKHPIQVYGATKLAFESVLEGYFHAFGLSSVSLRYFNAYGPGDLQEPVSRAIPRWIRAALLDQPIVMYWQGKQLRDYVFVQDIAEAHIAALRCTGLRTYNIGSGTGIWMHDVASALGKVLGRPLQIIHGGNRPGDPTRLVADTARVTAELQWQPIIDLETGLRQTVDFYDQNRRLWDSTSGADQPSA